MTGLKKCFLFFNKLLKGQKLKSEKLLTVGELSRISNLSTRILRHYDKIGLLKPEKVDAQTHYRYYSPHQIFFVSLIQDLKSMGFSLAQVKEAMHRENLNHLKSLYQKRQKEVEKDLEKLLQMKENISYRLELFDKIALIEHSFKKDKKHYFELKKLPSRRIIYKPYQMSFNFDSVALQVRELQKTIENNEIKSQGPYLMIFHANYPEPQKAIIDLACFLSPSEKRNLKDFKEIPQGLFLTSLYQGTHENSVALYQEMIEWIKKHQYTLCGSPLKIYLKSLAFTDLPQNLLAEIQIPVKKV